MLTPPGLTPSHSHRALSRPARIPSLAAWARSLATFTSLTSLAALTALTPLGCGSDSSDRLPTMGMSGIPSPVLVAQNVLLVDTSLNGHPGGRLLADTGSPFTLIDPSKFPGATLPAKAQVEVNLSFGAFTVDKVPALQTMAGVMEPLSLAGIVGGNLFRQFSTQFDYRDRAFRLGEGVMPADIAIPGTSVPFRLSGGGIAQLDMTSTVTFPATRVPVTVSIEGVDHPFIVDTGASNVAVRSSVFANLTSDGRTVLAGLPLATASGLASARVVRAKSVAVAGEVVTSVPIMSLADDTLLDNLVSELGHPLDGLLGGDFLREFLVTIDYPKGVLHLQRYASRAHIVDDFKRVGIEIADAPSGATQHYLVAAVFAGSDAAAKGISKGDEILAVDGHDLSTADPLTADNLFDGTPGDLRQVTLGKTKASALSNATISVRVDDLIP